MIVLTDTDCSAGPHGRSRPPLALLLVWPADAPGRPAPVDDRQVPGVTRIAEVWLDFRRSRATADGRDGLFHLVVSIDDLAVDLAPLEFVVPHRAEPIKAKPSGVACPHPPSAAG